MRNRLYRSRDDRMLAGVCGGVADWMDIDSSLVRIAFALLGITGGIGLVLYIVMAIVVPEEPSDQAMPAGPGDAGATPPAAEASQPGGAGPASAGFAAAPAVATQPSSSGREHDASREARRAARRAGRVERDGRAGMVFGAILVLVGAWFLIRRYLPAFDDGFVGPLLLIAVGVIVLVAAMGRAQGGGPPKAR